MTSNESAQLATTITALAEGIECLCQNISGLRAELSSNQEQLALLRARLEQIFGQIDRMELYMATEHGYPRTQAEIPGADQLRQRIQSDGERLRLMGGGD